MSFVKERKKERNNGIGILIAETGRETGAFYSLKDSVISFNPTCMNL
jgi:hypothetical protein